MRRVIFLALGLTVLTTAAGAIESSAEILNADMSRVLPVREERALNTVAFALYREALEDYDHADYESLARHLAAAAKEQTDHVPLQMIAMANCIDRGEMNYSEAYGGASGEFFELADGIIKRLSAMDTLTPEQRDRVQRAELRLNGRPATSDKPAVTGARDGVLQRDLDRLKTGLELMLTIQAGRQEARGFVLTGSGERAAFAEGRPSFDTRGGPGEKNKLKHDPFATLPNEAVAPVPGATPAPGVPGAALPPPGSIAPAAENPFANDQNAAPPPP